MYKRGLFCLFIITTSICKRGYVYSDLLGGLQGHVAVGSRWFRYVCDQRGLNPFVTFQQLLAEYFYGKLQGPFNYEARRQAGFSDEEITWLQKIALGNSNG